jgi:hypothetical protein
MEMLRGRIADEGLMRLVGKCLHVGVLDGEEFLESDEGTAQGSSLSPLLGNIYLHNVLDVWFEREVKPRLHGRAALVRYADDFVLCFEREDDSERVWKVLSARFAKYGLTLHPKKTRRFSFRAPHDGDDSGGETFDFLGFTAHWRRTRSGMQRVAFRTRGARVRRALKAAYDWCRRHRHLPVKQQHQALVRKLNGHFNYFGVNGNSRALLAVRFWVTRAWRTWLNRRSQRSRMNWKRFKQLLARYPLPYPRIRVQLWGPRQLSLPLPP